MTLRCAEDESWEIGTCENPRCGREGVNVCRTTIWDAMRPERFRTIEFCNSCRDAFDRGDLKLDRIPPDQGPHTVA